MPTYGSWLNWIESEFAALSYFALNGTDHRSHGEQNAAIVADIRWHNARAQPKAAFAPDSPSGTGPATRPGLLDRLPTAAAPSQGSAHACALS
ncbi:hypothetical protein [Kribbella sancticallisti]